METYAIRDMGNGVRCRWVYDEDYDPIGSFGYETETETRAAENETRDKLRSGEWVALGCIVERECTFKRTEWHSVLGGGLQGFGDTERGTHWHETDSCWGIVIEPDSAKLDEYARWGMNLGEKANLA